MEKHRNTDSKPPGGNHGTEKSKRCDPQPGKTGREVDAVARKIIVDAGFGDYFGHGLGHGLGLYIHEDPRLSPSNTQTVLMENMVVTVEPGIYLPEWGGIRIEDTVLVSTDGCQILTASSKHLIEISNK